MFTLRNLVDGAVTSRLPWEYNPTHKWSDKDEQMSILQDVTTEHMVFGGTEGLDPHQRIGDANPPVAIHHIVVDFDSNVPSVDPKWTQNCRLAKPQWLSRTIRGGVRLVYELDSPIGVHDKKLYEKFMYTAADRLGLRKLFPGFDEAAFKSPFTYYDVGSNWERVSNEKIGTNHTWAWMQKAGSYVGTFSGIEVPLEVVAKEAERKWPNRWASPWTDGSRGVRFWDEMADNTTACVLRATGCQCFTGGKAFMTWSEIFGRSFVQEYEDDRIGGAIEPLYFDHPNNKFWLEMPNKTFQKRNCEDVRRWLKTMPRLSGAVPKGDTCSEVDSAIIAVQSHKGIDGAVAMLYKDKGVHHINGTRILNTSNVEPLTPASTSAAWGEEFPWLAKYVGAFFDTEIQRDTFHGWLQRAYVNALNNTPAQGQALFLAGGAGTGKTFLGTCILPKIFGAAHANPLKLMTGTSHFSGSLYESPIWSIDDATPASDPKSRKLYSANLKAAVANRFHSSEFKGRDAITMEWMGRIIITCNLDPESIQVLPDLDMNNQDKAMLMRVGDSAKDCLEAKTDEEKMNFQKFLVDTIDKEAPHYCAWLKDEFVLPDELWGDSRFGVKSYHHPELITAVDDNSVSVGTAELLVIWAEAQNGANEHILNATEILATLQTCGNIEKMLQGVNREGFGRRLGSLVAHGSFPLERRRKKYILDIEKIKQWSKDQDS